MIKFQLFINRFAENDLENSINYYEEQKYGLGNKFLLELKETIKRIEGNPYQFPKIERKARKANLTKFPFAILFVVDGALINVFSIFHLSRNPNIWKDRMFD